MFSHLSIVVLLLSLVACRGQVKQRYCAVISADEASGATGWYDFEIEDDGQGEHLLEIDLSGFTALPGSCDVSGGLTYHIHSFWDDASMKMSGDNGDCGFASTGNHYDPYLACGPNTEESTSCAALGRTTSSVPAYTYPCSPEVYASGQYGYCEVGDTSGKFGKLVATDPDMVLFSASATDPSPALIPAYASAGQLSNQWVSVVVHCGSSRILCAKFLPVDATTSCGGYNPLSEEDDDDEDLNFTDLSKIEGALLWSGIIIICALLGIFVGYKFLHGGDKDKSRQNLLDP